MSKQGKAQPTAQERAAAMRHRREVAVLPVFSTVWLAGKPMSLLAVAGARVRLLGERLETCWVKVEDIKLTNETAARAVISSKDDH